jgi:hypothetical protein
MNWLPVKQYAALFKDIASRQIHSTAGRDASGVDAGN